MSDLESDGKTETLPMIVTQYALYAGAGVTVRCPIRCLGRSGLFGVCSDQIPALRNADGFLAAV